MNAEGAVNGTNNHFSFVSRHRRRVTNLPLHSRRFFEEALHSLVIESPKLLPLVDLSSLVVRRQFLP